MPTQVSAPTMRAVQVGKKSGPFEVSEKEIPNPDRGEVRVQVKACGICHSDVLTKENLWPGIQCPRSPGHEIAGVVDALGEGADQAWQVLARLQGTEVQYVVLGQAVGRAHALDLFARSGREARLDRWIGHVDASWIGTIQAHQVALARL